MNSESQNSIVSKPKVVVIHPGARMHYAVPTLLEASGLLAHMYTDAYVGQGSWLSYIARVVPSLLDRGAIRRLKQRFADVPGMKVTALNLWGLYALLLLQRHRRLGRPTSDFFHWSAQGFLSRVAASSGFKQGDLVYGFSTVSLEVFQRANELGLPCLCEQIIVPVQEFLPILSQEWERWSDWSLKQDEYWNPEVWFPREEEEWRLAAKIIAPSQYVYASLVKAGVPEKKIVIIPYAVSLETFKARVRRYDGNRSLRVLFVGSVDLRKGVPYLLNALGEFHQEQIDARLVGTVHLDGRKLGRFSTVADIVGRVSRKDILEFYDWADIFVLPSLSEGSAVVTYEAMASGLPRIVTPNTGAWIEEGKDGVHVPIRDSAGLANAIRMFLDSPGLVEEMSVNAIRHAVNYSWAAYQERLEQLVLSVASDFEFP